MPMFTWLQMNRHVLKSGKAIANVDHHTVPTGLVKARRFLDDDYLEDIEYASDSRYFFFKAKCCHSFRKSDPPHNLQIALCILSGEVASASCSCVAGKVGFCNHVLALMFKMCKYTLFSATTTKDLSEEQDQQSSGRSGTTSFGNSSTEAAEVDNFRDALFEAVSSKFLSAGFFLLRGDVRIQGNTEGTTPSLNSFLPARDLLISPSLK